MQNAGTLSLASMDLTKDALARLTASDAIELRLVDLFDAPSGDFDAVIFCEILEHMEFPRRGLFKTACAACTGRDRLHQHADQLPGTGSSFQPAFPRSFCIIY